MDTQPNQMPPQQSPEPMPRKKGHGGLIGVIVLILVILAFFLFGPKNVNSVPDTSSTAQKNESNDLSSLEADVKATQVDGASDGL